jgi:hypothetical protein
MLQGDLYLTQAKQVNEVKQLLKFKQRHSLVAFRERYGRKRSCQRQVGDTSALFGVKRKNITHLALTKSS